MPNVFGKVLYPWITFVQAGTFWIIPQAERGLNICLKGKLKALKLKLEDINFYNI